MTDTALEKVIEDFESQYAYLYKGTVYDNGGGNFSPVHESFKHWLRTALTQYAAEKVIEERQRIEDVFKQYVPPHPFDLEDGVWMQRLLNKAFSHTEESKEIKQ